jgi:hypothetical protein
MDPIYLLVGAAAFLLAKKKAPTGTSTESPEKSSTFVDPPTQVSPTISSNDRDRLILSFYNNDIPGLDFVAYARGVATPESNNRYRPFNQKAHDRGWPLGMNDHGFVGMYQVGAQGLEDQGFIKRGTWATPGTGGNYKILTTKANWTDKCPGGLEQFLNTPALQEEAMVGFTKANYRCLKRYKVLTDASSAQQKAGYLAASHLKGCGGGVALHSKISQKDPNGMSTDTYYRIGANSQRGVA